MWRDVEGYEGLYQVSDDGEVKSLSRVVDFGKSKAVRKERIMKQSIGRGYKKVSLSKCGVQTNFAVHRLVAQAFIDNPTSLPQVNHIDGVKTNNRVQNLEWCNAKHNTRHAHLIGLCKPASGENQGHSKLTTLQVLDALEMRRQGMTFAEIAKKVGCIASNVEMIVAGKTWRSVTKLSERKSRDLDGEGNGMAKLNRDKVLRVVELRKSGMSFSCIAKEIGCLSVTARNICTGKQWSSVTGIVRG